MMREVIVTNKCSLHCKHCGGPYIFSKFENTGNIVDAIERLSTLSNDDTICFAANESLVNPTSARRVKTIIDRFPYKKFVMYTNLVYILTDTKLDILKKCDTVVSFDLKTRFSNVRELFLWYHNAKKLLKTTDAGIGICITKYFKKDKIEKSFKLFDRMGFKTINFMQVNALNENIRDMQLNKHDMHEFIRELIRIHKERKYKIKDLTLGQIYHRKFSVCYSKENIPSVLPDGRIINGCYIYPGDKCYGYAQCLMCEDYDICGGRCILTPCYFDKDLYEEVKDVVEDGY